MSQLLGTVFWRSPLARQLCGWLCFCLLAAISWAQSSGGGQTTLEGQLQRGVTAFTEGAYPAARDAFDDLERVFGGEPEYRADAVQRVILPMRGYAALTTGRAEDAVVHFGAFLEKFGQDDAPRRAFALFALAQSQQQLGEIDAAIEVYGDFVAAFPETPEAGIAYLRVAELEHERRETDAALAALDRLFLSRQAFTLREQGRLRALQIASERGEMERASKYLLETPWEVERMPELAVLSFLALPIGDYLLSEKRPEAAIEAYRLVPSYEVLVERQRARLASTQRNLAQRSGAVTTSETGIWREFYRGMVGRLEGLMQQLESSESYTGGLYLRYGQAFSNAGRFYEAWTVFASVAEDPNLAEPVRREAHYRWVVETQNLERWSDALEVAGVFVDRYPDAPQAPMVLFLIANAHQQLREYDAAITLLTRLLEDYPGHPFYPRWRFSRGFNYLLKEENPAAREDFDRYLADYPETILATNAALWRSVSWFFDKTYPPALEGLDALLAETPSDHPLRPEIEYRRGTVLYAQRSYEPALEQIDSYLKAFPGDGHREEALVLRGDILMGLGRLLPAALAFRQVGPGAEGLFVYAVFQTGKIYRAMEEYERLANHFTDYAGRTDLDPHLRVSEALYWVGWAREQEGRLAEAFPIFEEAIARYGNDPEATEMLSIFGALHQAHIRLRQDPPEGGIDPSEVLLATPEFMDWIGVEQERALDEDLPTYHSRLRLYEADRLKAARRGAEARAIYLQLGEDVSIAALDAEGLGKVGLTWQEADREGAADFLLALVERYPNAIQRASAYLGLGRLAFAAGEFAEAEAWLRPLVETMPTHELGPEGSVLLGRTLIALKRPAEAQPILEDILKLRSARGRPHATALLVLGDAAEADGRPDAAIAYYQRVFNLYRAYPELVGEAYLRSARLFEARGDLASAWRTYREVVFFEELTDAATRSQAEAELARLDPLVPEAERELPTSVTETGEAAPPAESAPAAAPAEGGDA